MYCINCGQPLNDKANYCDNCGALVAKENKLSPPIIKTESPVIVRTEDEKIKVKYDNTASSIFQKIFTAAIISLIIGFLTYPISNSVLEVDKKELSFSDYPFQQKFGADNASLRREVLTDKSLENAKISGIVSFIIVLIFLFFRVEKKEKEAEKVEIDVV